MIIVGIDPGSAWTGYAAAEITSNHWRVWAASIDMTHRGFESSVSTLLKLSMRADVIAIERFQARPVGHQAFNTGDTLQLIGALRYGCESRRQSTAFIPPGDPDRELARLPIGPIMERWMREWPDTTRRDWHHAKSAWRILGRCLLAHDAELLSPFVAKKCPALGSFLLGGHPLSLKALTTDLVAPSAAWRTS